LAKIRSLNDQQQHFDSKTIARSYFPTYTHTIFMLFSAVFL